MKVLLYGIMAVAAFAVLLPDAATASCVTQRYYLSGVDKDSDVTWDFMCSSGRRSGQWSRIKVPSCWETQGFGCYYYGWEEPFASDETGYYRHCFDADRLWRGSRVDIVFEGVMTDTEVRINGRLAGDVHEGGFYRFRYDVTDLLRYGSENTLEVKVRKCPSDSSIYRAERQVDFWLFGGIYRPVYLEIKPEAHIAGLAVDARADGTLRVKPELSGAPAGGAVSVYVESIDGRRLSEPVIRPCGDTIATLVRGITPWTHEAPVLYRVVAELRDGGGGRLLHRVSETIGFRTVEFRAGDGLYLNGKRVIFKGVNRHCFWPESGRTLSRSVSLDDVRLIKSMNMNSVRMSHYPPDEDFLEMCDSMGLLVIDELCSWQKKYDTAPARRIVREVVERDRNHPSVILWANGNEGGWNTEVDDDFRFYDLQERFVIHPWERFRGTDTKHYPDYNYVVNSSIYDHDIYFPTEFMHGIFDGGAAASLDDFWDVMMKHRAPAGGFLWALIDEGLVRADMNDSIDCRMSLAPDGILGPYREKEASYYAIRKIWSPLRVINRTIPQQWDGNLMIENSYMFTDLSDCALRYSLLDIDMRHDGTFVETVVMCDSAVTPECAPGERRVMALGLPDGWNSHDVLAVTLIGPFGEELYTYRWPIGDGASLRRKIEADHTPAAPSAHEADGRLTVNHGGNKFVFDCETGSIEHIITSRGKFSLSGAPRVVTEAGNSRGMRCYRDGDNYVVEPQYGGSVWIRWVFAPGHPAKVDYSFSVEGEADFIGLGFDYPEDKVLAMDWIGDGLYRVWKNRMESTGFGCYHKAYNNTVTGESWNYPEFKGFHADCRAVTVTTTEGCITFVPSGRGVFFQMLTPQKPRHDDNGYTMPPFPQTSFGFMHAIPPIGTKFQKPEQLGPSAQKNIQLNWVPYSGSISVILQ